MYTYFAPLISPCSRAMPTGFTGIYFCHWFLEATFLTSPSISSGIRTLTNQKQGHYYGVVADWPPTRRRRLGVHLLHRALLVFLAEGERELRPQDIQARGRALGNWLSSLGRDQGV